MRVEKKGLCRSEGRFLTNKDRLIQQCQGMEPLLATSKRLVTQEPTFLCVLYGKLVKLLCSIGVVTTEYRHIQRVFQPALSSGGIHVW